MSAIAHKTTKTTETTCKTEGMDIARINTANISMIRITESTHHPFIVGTSYLFTEVPRRRGVLGRSA
jgi:hypothetical protein